MHSTKIILATAITVLAGAFSTLAAPVNFNEVSLWVRAKDTDKTILTEVKERKLAKALTPSGKKNEMLAIDELKLPPPKQKRPRQRLRRPLKRATIRPRIIFRSSSST